jgi:PAS domain S-box-containing protein
MPLHEAAPNPDADEQRLQGFLDYAPDASLLVAGDGKIVRANAHAESLLGYAAGGLDGLALEALLPAALRAKHVAHREAFQAAPRTRAMGASLSLVALRADGAEIPVEISLSPVQTQRGLLTAASIRDVSERRQMEAALRESEESLAITLSSIGDAVIATDLQGRVTRLNPVAEAVTGWPLAEARGRALPEVFRIVDELTGAVAESPFDRVSREGGAVSLAKNTTLIARDGTRRPITDSGAPIRDAAGKIRGIVLVFRDMTEERRADERLGRTQAELEETIRRMPAAVAIRRADRLVVVNESMTATLGFTHREELLGRSILELVLPEDERALRERLERPSASDGPLELRFARPGGDTAVLEVGPVLEIQYQGAPASLLVARDITERKKMESQLLLADRMVSVGTLAAGVAHEINNPLAVVTANLALATDELGALGRGIERSQLSVVGDLRTHLTEALDELSDAREAAERVRLIVKDLKTFSRVDEEARGPVDLQAVIGSSITMAWNEIRHRAKLTREFSEVPVIWGNEARLGQVFLNLLINAAQAIPEGAADRHEIRIVLRPAPDERVVVEVHDTGGGIPASVLPRIFDPFFTTKPIGVGTGLGLSICHSIITSQGGSLEVESQVGHGTVFRVLLSSHVPETSRATRPRSSVPTSPDGCILIVDDEEQVGRVFQRMLGKQHEVLALQSAREALERIRGGERFDLIFCDLMMPEMSGIDFHAELSQLDEEQAGRVVFTTGGAFTPRAQEFLSRIKNAYLEKPFDARQVLALVRDRLA